MQMQVQLTEEFTDFLVANFEKDAVFELVLSGFELNNGDVKGTFRLVNNSDA